MERKKLTGIHRTLIMILILSAIGGVAFAAGVAWSIKGAQAADETTEDGKRVRYPKRTELDFEGVAIEGEVRNPGEFYFQRKPEEKFDSLVKRRPNFHREMLRDAVLTK